MNDERNKRPLKVLHNYGHGNGVSLAAWKNPQGYQIKIGKTYKDAEGNRKESNYFYAEDMLTVAHLCTEMVRWINDQEGYLYAQKKLGATSSSPQEVVSRKAVEDDPLPF